MSVFSSIETAIEEIRQGRMVILVDDENRENEGDLVIAAEKITPASINFMATYGRGLIHLTLPEKTIQRLGIPLMPERNKHTNQAPFAVSIEAAMGVTTGASVQDRVKTIRTAIHPDSTYEDISLPGHVFPLQARTGGVLVRAGHTEGSVDLSILAGLTPGAVLCEILREDGQMARLPDLKEFAEQHHIKLVSINDLISYRLLHEHIVEEAASADVLLEQGDFTVKVFHTKNDLSEHVVFIHGNINPKEPVLIRIHSECLTGDTFGSLRCDCGWQLHHALTEIAKQNGILVYMRQEGRGIGLANKIKAYHLQSQGFDTVEANHELGFAADHRCYAISAQILRHLNVKQVKILTNNPAKVQDIERYGISVVERVPLEMIPTEKNIDYLKTKRDKLGHWLTIKDT